MECLYDIYEQKLFTIIMGNTICSPQESQAQIDFSPFNFSYGEDKFYSKIPHQDSISCRDKQIEKILQDCELRLKVNERLYKDPTMNTDPIILRSLTSQNNQVKCTFQRPHIFLNDPSDPLKGKYKKYKIIDFADCRPSQIIIKDEVLQSFGILLCFLAQHPQLINNIILTDTNSYGICVVQMNVDSKKQYIYIDDYILCQDKLPLFAQPIRGIYMWPCLLQKAWFKVKGYVSHKIEKRSPLQIIKSFLSFPIKSFVFSNDIQQNQILLKRYLYIQQQDRGYIVSSRQQPPHKIGLSGRKHFYLLKIIDYAGKKLFYLRNPYTLFDFRGSYRILPEQLSTLIKKTTGDLKIHEGNFVLDESQFLEQIQQFSIINFCKSSQQVSEQSISIVVNKQFYVSMDLKTDSLVSMCFNQMSVNQKEKQYLPLAFHVISISDNTLVSDHQNDESCFGLESTLFFQNIFKPLKAGQYLIRLKKKVQIGKILRKFDKPDKIIVTASSKVRFDYKQPQLLQKYFKKFLLSVGKKKLQQKKINEKETLTNSGVQYIVFWLDNLAVLYFQKTNMAKKQIRVEVKFQNMKNLECINNQVGSGYYALPPIADGDVMVFQKILLTQAANLGAFTMEPY